MKLKSGTNSCIDVIFVLILYKSMSVVLLTKPMSVCVCVCEYSDRSSNYVFLIQMRVDCKTNNSKVNMTRYVYSIQKRQPI